MKRLVYPTALAFVCLDPAHAAEPPSLPTPWAQLQVWGTVYDGDEDPQADPAGYGDPEADAGVSIQRARVGLAGEYSLVDYEISVGIGAPFDVYSEDEPLVGIIDAVAGFNFRPGSHAIRLSAGVQKPPVGREYLIASSDLLFQVRAIHTEHLAPDRELGLLFDWDGGFGLRTRGGVFNGGGDLFGDDNWGKLAVARLEWAKGDSYTTFTHTRDDAWGVGLTALYDSSLATQTLQGGVDALVRFGPIAAFAEGTFSRIAPTATTVTQPDVEVVTDRWSAVAQVSAYVPVMEGGIEIGVRGDLFDDALSRRDNGDVLLITGGATWRDPVPGVDFGVGYVHRAEMAGSTHPNDTVRMWLQVRYPTWRARRVAVAAPAAEPLGKPVTPAAEPLDKPVTPAAEPLDKPVTPDPAPDENETLDKPVTPTP